MNTADEKIISKKWKDLKSESKSHSPNIDKIDLLSCELISILAELSLRGIKEVEGLSIDLMKDRVWWVIEKHNLLPEYKDPEEDGLFEVVDKWLTPDDEEDEINEDMIYELI
jgi:hypothetical protein